jgi:hypothetical protein
MAKLTSAQIRKIIKAHNIEATIKIPTGLKQAELEKFVESKGFTINHDEKSISKGGKKITLEQAEKVIAPKAKTALQKQKAEEKKQEKAVAQKKKERELKKEAVKKATKDMVPKTSVPKKIGSKPVPKKEEPKKEEPKKGKKKGEKVKFTEQAKEVQKKIIERKKKKELEARKPKRKVLGETKKPSGSAVVQPGKPEGLEIKNKKPKPQPKELNEVEKNRCIKAVNNARSVISLYEQKGGKIKDSDFSSKKDLMETIKDLKDIRPQLKLCPKSEQDIVDKALSLHNKKPKPQPKEAPPVKEKVETSEEKFFRILKYVISQYNKLPSQYGYVDMPQNRKNKLINVLGSIIDKKKTSKFTKPETEVLQRAMKFLKSDKAEEDVKILESILKGQPKAEPKKEEKNTFESKGQEIKELFTKALSPELKKAYQSKDTNKMKTAYNKAVNILSEYLGKTGFATSVAQARRNINNGILGRIIKGFGEGKELKEPFIFRKIDLTDVYNRSQPKAAPKAEPKKEKPAWLIKAEKERAESEQKEKVDMLKAYKDRWEKNFKKQYQWTDAQVKRIEEILFDKNGIKSTGAENVPDGFKLFFSVDGKSESSATFKFPKFTEKKKEPKKEKN